MIRVARQIALIVVISAAGGAMANAVRSGDARRYLDWWPAGKYIAATTVKGCDHADPAPAVAAGENPAATGGIPTAGTGSQEAPPPAVPEPEEPPYPHTDFEGALDHARGGSTFVDARRSEEYLAGHIPGAYSVPAWEDTGVRVNRILEEGVVLDAPAVVYCSSSKDCEDSLIVSQTLEQAGFTDIVIYKGGFPEWAHQLPKLVVKGAEPGEMDLDALPEESE